MDRGTGAEYVSVKIGLMSSAKSENSSGTQKGQWRERVRSKLSIQACLWMRQRRTRGCPHGNALRAHLNEKQFRRIISREMTTARTRLRFRLWGRLVVWLERVLLTFVFGAGAILGTMGMLDYPKPSPRVPHGMSLFTLVVCLVWLAVMVPSYVRCPFAFGSYLEVERDEIRVYSRRRRCVFCRRYRAVDLSRRNSLLGSVCFTWGDSRWRSELPLILFCAADRQSLVSLLEARKQETGKAET